MKFSLVDGKKAEPFPKGKGICPSCGNETLSKCGNRKVWHWAHCSNKMCDSWWENETLWHREWKKFWDINNQEVVQFDDVTGEKHIADVKNNSGVVIEFQNSPIKEDELLSREKFYKNMIWIVNADKFKKNITFGAKLPNPDAPGVDDMCIYPNSTKGGYFIYYRESERRPDSQMVKVQDSHQINDFVKESHCGHYLFTWKRPRSVWFTVSTTVFFDFGDEILWNLVKFNSCSPHCFKAFSKLSVIEMYGGKCE